MGMQIRASYHPNACVPPALPIPSTALRSLYSSSLSPFVQTSSSRKINLQRLSPGSSSLRSKITRTRHGVVASSNVSAPLWDSWKPDSTTPASVPSFSDIFWPSAGNSLISLSFSFSQPSWYANYCVGFLFLKMYGSVWTWTGAFAAMAIFGKMDQMLAPKGISMTIAPLGAVAAILFATPSSPGARVCFICSS